MNSNPILKSLGRAFHAYAGLAVVILLFQLTGLVVYVMNVWPAVRETLPAGVSSLVAIATGFILIRSCIWVWIYRCGGKTFTVLHRDGESPDLAKQLNPLLKLLTLLLVVSCILDLCFVPVILISDTLLPLPVSSLWLGAVDAAVLLFPQVFGVGALILAYLADQYRKLLAERSRMKQEIGLTI